MLVSYLNIPYLDIEQAKDICRTEHLPMVIFDPSRKKWYFRGDSVPFSLTNHFPVIEVAEEPAHLARAGSNKPAIKRRQSVNLKLTDEQLQFIKCEPGGHENLLIGKAFAGAAKTTTMRAYAEARPQSSFILLAFSNAVAQTARETFPENTYCTTVHALARRWLPDSLKRKAAEAEELKSDTICQLLGVKPLADNLATASFTRTLLHGFFVSSDLAPHPHHLGHLGDMLLGADPNAGKCIEDILGFARTIWGMMIDPSQRAPLTHDAYLKLYALSEPTWNYDYALLDEGQDTNPVTEDLFFRQKIRKIVVGDPHQNIFRFRNAQDILSPHTHAETPCVYLTHSFRFGPQVAELANVVLRDFKDETVDVVGRGQPATILAPGSSQWHLEPTGRFTPFTWISRSNADLFRAAVEVVNILDAYERVVKKPAPKIAFIGTSARMGFSPFHAYKLGRLLDLVRLADGKLSEIKDPFIGRFTNIKELWEIVTNPQTADPDLSSAIRIYHRYKRALYPLVSQIIDRCTDPKDPDVWVRFTTAHKSKGLEWPRVRLADDFVKLVDDKNDKLKIILREDAAPEEYNLLYVAITRAQQELELNGATALYLRETDRAHIMANFMPGSVLCERSSITWPEAVKYFGGDPVAIRAAVDAEREAAAKARKAQSNSSRKA